MAAGCECGLRLRRADPAGPFPFPPAGRMSPYCYRCWAAAQPAGARPKAKPRRKGLGDAVAWLLKLFGVTPAWWSKMMGKACNCRTRQAALNRWGWAAWDRVRRLSGYSRGA